MQFYMILSHCKNHTFQLLPNKPMFTIFQSCYLYYFRFIFRHTSTLDFFQANAAHMIWTCKPFTANGFQDRPLTTRTYGKYSSVVELLYSKLLLPPLCTISHGLSTAYDKVHPCRKLAQCVGPEPTRRINARRLSKPFQYHCGNTASWWCDFLNNPSITTVYHAPAKQCF